MKKKLHLFFAFQLSVVFALGQTTQRDNRQAGFFQSLKNQPIKKFNFIGQDGKTYFQVQLFFRVMNYNTKEPMYEFRTCSDYFWDDDLDSPDHPDFMPTAVATIQSAIPDFNWYIKNNKSYLTMEKFYTQNPTVENSEKHIRSAYLRYKLNLNGPPKK